MSLDPFKHADAISYSKEALDPNDGYDPYIVNLALSYYSDCIMSVNEMNLRHQLPVNLQQTYYINTISKRKRYARWVKKVKNEELNIIMQYYGYSREKALDAAKILSKQEISEIKERLASCSDLNGMKESK